jgi:uncharacterized protein YkwD
MYGIKKVVVPTSPPIAACPAPKPKLPGSSREMAVVRLTNQERVKRGLPPLKVNTKMMADAKGWSVNQASRQRMYHSRMGYGENVCYGYQTPEAAVSAWMNSRGHRKNILNGNYTQIGVGLADSRKGSVYATQCFQ